MSDEGQLQTADPKEKAEKKHYQLWHVVFHNDDYTCGAFVVDLLCIHFGHSEERALSIVMQIHFKGEGIAGTYSRDIAETKSAMALSAAREAEHPLAISIRPAA